MLTRKAISNAVAQENSNKIMDVTLAEAITENIIVAQTLQAVEDHYRGTVIALINEMDRDLKPTCTREVLIQLFDIQDKELKTG